MTGSWVGASNAGAAYVNFTVAAGTSLLGTASTWVGSNYAGVTGSTNGVSSASNTFQVTGVSWLPSSGGDLLTSANAWAAQRSYVDDYALSQRYWEPIQSFVGGADSATALALWVPFQTGKRASPTVAQIAGSTLSYRTPATDVATASWTLNASTPQPWGVWMYITGLSSLTTGQAVMYRASNNNTIATASARI